MIYFYSFGLAFIFSTLLTPIVIYIARRLRVLDFPAEPRKLHEKPTALLGGFALFGSFFITLFFFLRAGYIIDSGISGISIAGIFVGGAIIMIGGFLDDAYNLKPNQQMIFPLLATCVAIFSGTYISFVTNPFGGIFHISGILGILITFLWLLGMMYTTKFLDGLDGLVSGVSAIGSIIIFIVSLFWDISYSGTSIMSLILAGSAIGFLIYNFYPAKIFLGEGGSVFLGYMLGILSIISGSKIATAILIMGFPIIDTLIVILRRIWKGRSPIKGDREHFHFSLIDSGMDQGKAVLTIYCTTLLFGITSLFLGTGGKIFAIIILIIISLFLITKFYLKTHESKRR